MLAAASASSPMFPYENPQQLEFTSSKSCAIYKKVLET